MRRAALCAALLLAGCPHREATTNDKPTPPTPGAGDARAPVAADDLPPAPPLPAVPAGLPPLPDTAEQSAVTPDALALGALLFADPRLSASGKTACATCHDPAHGYSGRVDTAADGKPNLRRTPALVDLAWSTAFGWDGRYASLADLLTAHVKGQLGAELPAIAGRLAADPLYAKHLARVGGEPADATRRALAAFVLTRYAGDAPWDRREASARRPKPGEPPADAETAGYLLFTGKAQCAVCHTPPLYTDHGYHRVGKIGVADPGRGRVDPAQAQAFATPTLRGAAARPAFFHTGDAATLSDAIAWYGDLGKRAIDGVHPSDGDPVIARLTLTPEERTQLAAFVRALSAPGP